MKKNELRDRLLKNSQLGSVVAILSESLLFTDRDMIPTPVPMVNVALSGRINGGICPGVTMLAGPSKHFKTAFGLLMVSSFLKKYPDGVIIFYDSEFGTNEAYFETFGINKDNIIHCPVTTLEDLIHDMTVQLKSLTKEDHVMIFIDSLGNLASLHEVTLAEEGKDKADMTRAKKIKSLFRIIGPHLTIKDIPCIAVNHTYKEQVAKFPRDIVSGGTGPYYNANDIWIIGRQQDKEDDELAGYNFIINIEKSRTVKEKSKIPITVSFETGIFKYSGLFDLAMEAGLITSPTKGYYQVEGDSKKYRRADIEESPEVWDVYLKTPAFTDFIEKKYRLSTTQMITDDPVVNA